MIIHGWTVKNSPDFGHYPHSQAIETQQLLKRFVIFTFQDSILRARLMQKGNLQLVSRYLYAFSHC